ncbi:RICIN domain-containing protein [Nonomuraea sp. NPDC050643]|uniref:RICIN domain-containing protein n=1 Tax=Nonomuraea sp. NPDC050643 TaxID=3155660 RepID=UPI0033DF33CF
MREYGYGGTDSRPQGFLYWLHTDTDVTRPPNRVNLAIATRSRASAVYVVESPIATGRPALGATIDGVVYFTVHGFSPGGNDMAGLVDRIRTRMATAGPNGTALPWVVMGDFNREPGQLRTALDQRAPGQFRVNGPPQVTHPTQPRFDANNNPIPPRSLDYAVTLNAADAPRVTAHGVADRMLLSDHFPVVYEIGGLPDRPPPSQLETPNPPEVVVLQNAHTTNVAGPLGGGSHVIGNVPYDQATLPGQTWALAYEPESPGYYRLVNRQNARYLGQEGGVRDARVVLWPNEAADQLWRPVYQGDGTWTLENMVTDQLLTAVNGVAALAGRDPDGSGAQRWFLQNPDEMGDLVEVGLEEPTPVRFVANVEGASASENTRVILYQDSDAPNERFTAIPAGRTGTDDCRYLIYRGKYLNSTASTPLPLNGNGVTLNSFRPNDDGYLWCQSPAPQGLGMLLSNHSFEFGADQRMYLTENGENGQLTIRSGVTPDIWTWQWVTG